MEKFMSSIQIDTREKSSVTMMMTGRRAIIVYWQQAPRFFLD